jgi:hypothetical protein
VAPPSQVDIVILAQNFIHTMSAGVEGEDERDRSSSGGETPREWALSDVPSLAASYPGDEPGEGAPVALYSLATLEDRVRALARTGRLLDAEAERKRAAVAVMLGAHPRTGCRSALQPLGRHVAALIAKRLAAASEPRCVYEVTETSIRQIDIFADGRCDRAPTTGLRAAGGRFDQCFSPAAGILCCRYGGLDRQASVRVYVDMEGGDGGGRFVEVCAVDVRCAHLGEACTAERVVGLTALGVWVLCLRTLTVRTVRIDADQVEPVCIGRFGGPESERVLWRGRWEGEHAVKYRIYCGGPMLVVGASLHTRQYSEIILEHAQAAILKYPDAELPSAEDRFSYRRHARMRTARSTTEGQNGMLYPHEVRSHPYAPRFRSVVTPKIGLPGWRCEKRTDPPTTHIVDLVSGKATPIPRFEGRDDGGNADHDHDDNDDDEHMAFPVNGTSTIGEPLFEVGAPAQFPGLKLRASALLRTRRYMGIREDGIVVAPFPHAAGDADHAHVVGDFLVHYRRISDGRAPDEDKDDDDDDDVATADGICADVCKIGRRFQLSPTTTIPVGKCDEVHFYRSTFECARDAPTNARVSSVGPLLRLERPSTRDCTVVYSTGDRPEVVAFDAAALSWDNLVVLHRRCCIVVTSTPTSAEDGTYPIVDLRRGRTLCLLKHDKPEDFTGVRRATFFVAPGTWGPSGSFSVNYAEPVD